MSSEKVDHPTVELMTRNRWSGADAPAYDVQAGHLLCAACVRGGCDSPPCGRAVADALLDVLRAHPRLMLRIRTDLDLARTHYLDVYENRRTESLPRILKSEAPTSLNAARTWKSAGFWEPVPTPPSRPWFLCGGGFALIQ